MNGGKRQDTRLKSNMTIAIYPATDWGRWVWCPSPKGCTGLVLSALEGDVDIYTIIFAAHAMVHAETCPAMA
jgi:hypothetical protein